MLYINTSTQLILFLFFVLTLSVWSLSLLLGLMLMFVLLFVFMRNKHFYRLTKRLKWFYLVMFFIFAFNTPGQYIDGWPFIFKPTYEGFKMGLTQVLRIALVLATLSIILTQNTKQQLISGLYFLLKPLSCFGLDIQRFAARLWLTLHYVELEREGGQRVSSSLSLSKKLEQAFLDSEDDNLVVELAKPRTTWVDCASIILAILFSSLIFFR